MILKNIAMNVYKLLFVLLAITSVMTEQIDWFDKDNPDLVKEAEYTQRRKHIKQLVVIEGEDINLKCWVAFIKEPVSKIVWKVDRQVQENDEQPIMQTSIDDDYVHLLSHYKISKVSRAMDGTTVSCAYFKDPWGGRVVAVLAVFKMDLCLSGSRNDDIMINFKEANGSSPGEINIENRIKAKISNLTGEDQIRSENEEYSVTAPYGSLRENQRLIELHPQLITDGLDRIQPCQGVTSKSIMSVVTKVYLKPKATQRKLRLPLFGRL